MEERELKGRRGGEEREEREGGKLGLGHDVDRTSPFFLFLMLACSAELLLGMFCGLFRDNGVLDRSFWTFLFSNELSFGRREVVGPLHIRNKKG